MSIELNHTIVHASDQERTAAFLADILGTGPVARVSHFSIVRLDNGVSLDVMTTDRPVRPQHYAFLVDEARFEQILGRIRERGLTYWADPGHARPGEVNRLFGGRGLYWADPDGHNLEILTAVHSDQFVRRAPADSARRVY